MEKIAKQINDLSEYPDLHNEDCCVHFPEDNRACDVGTPNLGCCENMETLKSYMVDLVESVINNLSYDLNCKDEEQRKAVVKMYIEDLKSKIK